MCLSCGDSATTDPTLPFGRRSGLYTAISIYVVGSKLQGYETRPKGGMGRLELIFRLSGLSARDGHGG